MNKIVILFLPSLCGLMWHGDPIIFIAWSLSGSVFIGIIAQTRWFTECSEDLPVSHRLLRPLFMYQLFFIGYHVVGGTCHALAAAGYSFGGVGAESSEYNLRLDAAAQELMLLAQASATAGMKLAGIRYGPPKYLIPYIPPYLLMVFSFICLGVGTVLANVPSLGNLSYRVLQIASVAILVEITFAVAERKFQNFIATLALFLLNVMSQVMSGWRGLTLWTMITLGALLYPLMPRRVLFGGAAFTLIWALYLHPFGTVLRPLLWYQGVDRDAAAAISIEKTINMSFGERLDHVWALMAGRANDLYQFGKYLQYVPDAHPYFGLDLAKEALVALVPRIIWPDKPDLERIAMQRVYDAGIVSEQSNVSAKSNFYQDAYMSGGWPVVILASLILGIVSILVSCTCERLFGGYEIGTCLVFTGLFATELNQTSNFLFFVGNICTSLFVMCALFFLGRATGWIVPAPNALSSSKNEGFIERSSGFDQHAVRL